MFYHLLSILAILWIIDLVQTINLTRKYGDNVEENPFARFLLKQSRKEFVLFKIVDLVILGAVMMFLRSQQIVLAECLLLSFILLYVFTVVHNYRVSRTYSQ